MQMETIHDNSIPYHVLTIDECIRALDASRHGLATPEANLRLAAVGPNELEEPERTPPWVLLVAQFKNCLLYTSDAADEFCHV